MDIKKVVLTLCVALGVIASTQAGPVDGLVTTLQAQVGTQLLNFVNSSLVGSSELPALQRIIAGMGSNLAYLQAQANGGDMGAATAFGTIAGILGSDDITVKLQSADDVRRLMTSFMNASSLLERSSSTTVPTTSVYVMQLYYDFSYVLSKLPPVVIPTVAATTTTTETTTTTSAQPEPKRAPGGLSAGVIAGIAAGAVAIIGGAMFVAYKVNEKRKARRTEVDSGFQLISQPLIAASTDAPGNSPAVMAPAAPVLPVEQSAVSATEVLTVGHSEPATPVVAARDDVALTLTSDSAAQSSISLTREQIVQVVAALTGIQLPPAAASSVAARQLPQLEVITDSHAISPDTIPVMASASPIPVALGSAASAASAAVLVTESVLNVQENASSEASVTHQSLPKEAVIKGKPESPSVMRTLLCCAGAASMGAFLMRLVPPALNRYCQTKVILSL
ncbi:MAG: hypothetical protein QG632_484 [Candidatus Dependentiae bacterium]|nr:hypothetical protein [Candidatus Dependentiae bacterium]